jgi:hypothetical protein
MKLLIMKSSHEIQLLPKMLEATITIPRLCEDMPPGIFRVQITKKRFQIR